MNDEPDFSSEFPGYYLGAQWKGRDRFCCKYCAYDSLSEVAVRDHLVARHQNRLCMQPKVKTMDVPLYGPDNRLIETREVADGEN